MKMLPLITVALVCSVCATGETTASDVHEIATEDLCRLRLVEGNFYTVIAELERRSEFSDDDLLQIRSPGDEFDSVYIYGLETVDKRRLRETRVYLADGNVVRLDELPMIVSPIFVN